jgi:hypothetical protein
MSEMKKAGPHGWLQALWVFEPMRHARWESLFLRLGVAYIAWWTFTGDSAFTAQPFPNGVAIWWDLTWLSEDRVEGPLRELTRWSLVAWVMGVPAVIALLVPTFFGIGLFTLKNSQGAIGHSFQVVHLCLLVVWIASLWSWIARWRKKALPYGFTAAQLELDWARQALAAGYVVSAITKLVNSGGLWFRDSHYFALHLIKNNDMKFYGTLEGGSQQLEWLPQLMMQNPMLSQLFFGLSLPLELLAFMGCRNRRLALLFGLSLMAFHYSVKQLTQLDFALNVQLLLVLMVNPVWWVKSAGERLLMRRG